MKAKSPSDRALLRDLGSRIARHRLNLNLTQDELAGEAGISRPTLARLEAGSSSSLITMIRVLRVLGLLGNLDALIPTPPESPIQQLQRRGRTRRRASSRKSEADVDAESGWSWGDES